MGGGYVRLHRDSIEHAVFEDEWLWKVFTWCMMKANFKDFNSVRGLIPRGSFTTGRFQAAEELGANPSRVVRAFAKLESLGSITVKTNNRFSTITVCNYDTYNSDCGDERTTNEQQTDSQRTTNEHTSEQQTNTSIKRQERKKAKRQKQHTYTPDFQKFWEVFPPLRKTSKPAAYEAWEAAINREQPEAIIAAAEEFAASWLANSEFCPGPAPWLNQDRWHDDRRAWQERKQSQPVRQSQGSIDGL